MTATLLLQPDTDRDTPWWTRAACLGRWAQFTEGDWRGSGGALRAGRVAHTCIAHCPVRRHCALAAQRRRPMEVVQAGVLWPAWTSRPPINLPDPGCGPWCAHLREDQ